MTSGTATSASVAKRRIALHEALSFFRIEWARNHLLGKMPAVDAAILSSPLQRLHTCSVENNMSFDPVDQGQSSNKCGTILSSESVMIRAYTKDGINVGYCLSEMAGLSGHDFMDCINGPSVQNFIVREHDGLYIGVIRHPHAELLLYLSCVHRTTRFYCFVFPGSVFFNLVDQSCGNVSALERVLRATVHFEYVKECPICVAGSSIMCFCSSSLRASAMKNNIDYLHLVHAKGSGMFDIFSNGVPKITTRLNVNVNAVPCANQGREKRFVNWAVACVLKNTTLEVSRGVTSSVGEEQYNGETFNCPQSNVTHVPTIQAAREISQEISVLQESFNNSSSLAHPDIPALERQNHKSITEEIIFFDSQVNTENAFPEDSLANTTETPLPAKTWNSRLILPRHTVLVEPVFPLSADFSSTSRHSAPPVPSKALLTASHGTEYILPRLSVVQIPDEESIKKTAAELRKWKAYHRKIRNRESAMRSNLRKQRKRRAHQNQHQTFPDGKQV